MEIDLIKTTDLYQFLNQDNMSSHGKKYEILSNYRKHLKILFKFRDNGHYDYNVMFDLDVTLTWTFIIE